MKPTGKAGSLLGAAAHDSLQKKDASAGAAACAPEAAWNVKYS